MGDIIDHENHTWLHSVVVDLFSEAEVDIILKLPLSSRSIMDSLVWHFDNKGLYTVKSGYHVAHTTVNFENHASPSDGRSNAGKYLWNKVWRSRVPPKVRVFMWRLLRGTLPTRTALAKKLLIPEILCVFCKRHAETDVHLFKECQALKYFWNSSIVGVKPNDLPDISLIEWIVLLLDPSRCQESDLLFMSFWVIWSERNKIVWNEGFFNPLFMASWAPKLLEEYQRFHPPKVKQRQRPLSNWELPPRGRLKMNIDGAFRYDLNLGGYRPR